MDTTITSSDMNTTNRMYHKRWLLVIGLFIAGIIFGIIILIAGIYELGWENTITRAVASIVPLPAGKAGGQTITCDAYFRRVQLLKVEQPTADIRDLQSQAFTQLANEILIQKYASTNKISADKKSVDALVAAQLKSAPKLNRGELRHQAETTVLAAQVNNSLLTSSVGQKLAGDRATAAVTGLANSAASAAAPSTSVIGSPQPIPTESLTPAEILPPSVQQAFKKLKPGQILSTPVSAPQGFFVGRYIKDDTSGQPQVKYALIVPTLDDWLSSQHINKDRHGYLPQTK